MKKWIRWQGLIAFIVISIAVSLFLFIFADGIVKIAIEKAGTIAVGAKVELAEADLTFSPIGFELNELKVTNPDEPMTNAVEFSRVTLSLDTLNLFRKKIIIKEMAVEDARFNTPREKSGAIVLSKKLSGPSEVDTSGQDKHVQKKMPSLDVKDVQSILKKEKLVTVEEVKKLQEDYEREKAIINNMLKTLPDEKKFETYKKRVEKLKKAKGVTEILKAAKDGKKLKKDIDKDVKQIKKTKRHFEKTVNGFKERVKKLPEYPVQDFNRLKEKYTLSPQGLGNLTALIFGEKYSDWVEKGLTWYQKLSPIIQKMNTGEDSEPEGKEPARGKGIYVSFKEEIPLPEFLIRKTMASVLVPAGDISGLIHNITNDQAIMGKPTTCEFTGENLKGIKGINITGDFNHIIPDKTKDTVNAFINEYQIKELSISNSKDFPLTMESAIGNYDIHATVQDENIDAKLVFEFSGVNFLKHDSGSNIIKGSLRNALADIKKFSITTRIKGTLNKYDVKITSDLDGVMKNAISKTVKQQTKEFEVKLKKEIKAATEGKINSLKENIASFDGINKSLKDRMKLGEELSKNIAKIR